MRDGDELPPPGPDWTCDEDPPPSEGTRVGVGTFTGAVDGVRTVGTRTGGGLGVWVGTVTVGTVGVWTDGVETVGTGSDGVETLGVETVGVDTVGVDTVFGTETVGTETVVGTVRAELEDEWKATSATARLAHRIPQTPNRPDRRHEPSR